MGGADNGWSPTLFVSMQSHEAWVGLTPNQISRASPSAPAHSDRTGLWSSEPISSNLRTFAGGGKETLAQNKANPWDRAQLPKRHRDTELGLWSNHTCRLACLRASWWYRPTERPFIVWTIVRGMFHYLHTTVAQHDGKTFIFLKGNFISGMIMT